MTNLTPKLILAALAATLAVWPALGEVTYIRAEVPFQFLAGDQVLPAGAYRVEVDPFHNRVEIRSVDGAAGAYVTAHTAGRVGDRDLSVLVFHKYGNAYVLRQVGVAGRSQGHELRPTRAEREMAKASRPVEVAMVTAR